MAVRIVDASGRLKTAKNARPLGTVQGMIYHHSVAPSAEKTINALNARRLGAEYVIDRDGTIYQTFPTGMAAIHMRDPGSSKRTDAGKFTEKFGNANFIGVEVAAADDADVTPAQVAAAQQLTADLSVKYGFPPQNVWGHGELQSNKQSTEGMTIVNAIRAANPAPPVAVDTAGRDKLAGVMLAEARGEGREGRLGVGNVVLNRQAASGNRFPKTIDEVINKDEFATPLGPNDVSPDEWAEATQEAAQLLNGAIPDNTGGAVYFANTATARPSKYAQIAASGPASTTIGNHTFHVDSKIGPVARTGAPQSAPAGPINLAGLSDPGGGTLTPSVPAGTEAYAPFLPPSGAQSGQAAIADMLGLPPPPVAQSFAPAIPETAAPEIAPAPFLPASGPIGPDFSSMLSPADVLNAGPRPRPAALSPVRPPMPNTMDRNLGILPPVPRLRPGGAPDAGMVPLPPSRPAPAASMANMPAMVGMPPSASPGGAGAFSAPAGPLDLVPFLPPPAASAAPAIAPPGDDRVATIQSIIDQGITDPNEIWGNLNMDRDGNLVGDITTAEIQAVLDRGQRSAPNAQAAIADEFGPGTPFSQIGLPPIAPPLERTNRKFSGQGGPVIPITPDEMRSSLANAGANTEMSLGLGGLGTPETAMSLQRTFPPPRPGWDRLQSESDSRLLASDIARTRGMMERSMAPLPSFDDGGADSRGLAREFGFNRRQMERYTALPPAPFADARTKDDRVALSGPVSGFDRAARAGQIMGLPPTMNIGSFPPSPADDPYAQQRMSSLSPSRPYVSDDVLASISGGGGSDALAAGNASPLPPRYDPLSSIMPPPAPRPDLAAQLGIHNIATAAPEPSAASWAAGMDSYLQNRFPASVIRSNFPQTVSALPSIAPIPEVAGRRVLSAEETAAIQQEMAQGSPIDLRPQTGDPNAAAANLPYLPPPPLPTAANAGVTAPSQAKTPESQKRRSSSSSPSLLARIGNALVPGNPFGPGGGGVGGFGFGIGPNGFFSNAGSFTPFAGAGGSSPFNMQPNGAMGTTTWRQGSVTGNPAMSGVMWNRSGNNGSVGYVTSPFTGDVPIYSGSPNRF